MTLTQVPSHSLWPEHCFLMWFESSHYKSWLESSHHCDLTFKNLQIRAVQLAYVNPLLRQGRFATVFASLPCCISGRIDCDPLLLHERRGSSRAEQGLAELEASARSAAATQKLNQHRHANYHCPQRQWAPDDDNYNRPQRQWAPTRW